MSRRKGSEKTRVQKIYWREGKGEEGGDGGVEFLASTTQGKTSDFPYRYGNIAVVE